MFNITSGAQIWQAQRTGICILSILAASNPTLDCVFVCVYTRVCTYLSQLSTERPRSPKLPVHRRPPQARTRDVLPLSLLTQSRVRIPISRAVVLEKFLKGDSMSNYRVRK